MKNFCVLLLILSFETQVIASEVWVTTPSPSSRDKLQDIAEKYRSQIKEGDFVSSFDYLIGHPADPSQMASILDLDSTARAASLNGSFKKALMYYLKLQEKLKSLPCVSGLEKIVLSTRVSLAHMSTMLKLPEGERMWQEAHSWAPDAVLSPEEFSPAVILQFSKSAMHLKKTRVQIKTTSNESFVFIDGQRIKKPLPTHSQLFSTLLEQGKHQVSVLAPGSNWTIKNFEVKEGGKPMELVVLPTPFVKGSCQNPQYVGHELPPKTKLLIAFDEDCSRVYFEKRWYTIEGVKIDQTVKVADLSGDLKPDSGSTSSNIFMEHPPKKGFVKELTSSGWFWAGLGVVIIGAIAISANQTTTVPSHTMQ